MKKILKMIPMFLLILIGVLVIPTNTKKAKAEDASPILIDVYVDISAVKAESVCQNVHWCLWTWDGGTGWCDSTFIDSSNNVFKASIGEGSTMIVVMIQNAIYAQNGMNWNEGADAVEGGKPAQTANIDLIPTSNYLVISEVTNTTGTVIAASWQDNTIHRPTISVDGKAVTLVKNNAATLGTNEICEYQAGSVSVESGSELKVQVYSKDVTKDVTSEADEHSNTIMVGTKLYARYAGRVTMTLKIFYNKTSKTYNYRIYVTGLPTVGYFVEVNGIGLYALENNPDTFGEFMIHELALKKNDKIKIYDSTNYVAYNFKAMTNVTDYGDIYGEWYYFLNWGFDASGTVYAGQSDTYDLYYQPKSGEDLLYHTYSSGYMESQSKIFIETTLNDDLTYNIYDVGMRFGSIVLADYQGTNYHVDYDITIKKGTTTLHNILRADDIAADQSNGVDGMIRYTGFTFNGLAGSKYDSQALLNIIGDVIVKITVYNGEEALHTRYISYSLKTLCDYYVANAASLGIEGENLTIIGTLDSYIDQVYDVESQKYYNVTFVDWDDTVLKATESLKFGSVPVPPTDPSRAADAQYTYTFKGWLPVVGTVTNDVQYKAQYELTVNEYTITFKLEDGTTYREIDFPYGTRPTVTAPTKAQTDEYTYRFTGWNTASDGSGTGIVDTVGPATYYAQFEEIENRAITFHYKNDQGTEVATIKYFALGSYPVLNTHPDYLSVDTTKTYRFSAWNSSSDGEGTAIVAVTVATDYYAIYTEITNYTVTFYDDDETTILAQIPVADGDIPVYPNEDPTKAATAEFTYTFFGWSPARYAVAGEDQVYVARYTAVTNQYEISWYNTTSTGPKLIKTLLTDYGVVAAYSGDLPEYGKADGDGQNYIFAGWNSQADGSGTAPVSVTGAASYYAQYSNLDVYGLVGGADGLAWGPDYFMTYFGQGIYEAVYTFSVDTQFKIRKNSAWTVCYGYENLDSDSSAFSAFTYEKLGDDLKGTGNIKVVTAGTYVIKLDVSKPNATKLYISAAPAASAIQSINLAGAVTGWKNGLDEYTLISYDGIYYTITQSFPSAGADGAFRFVEKGAWSDVVGSQKGYTTTSWDWNKIGDAKQDLGHGDENFYAKVAGKYTFTIVYDSTNAVKPYTIYFE